MNKQKISKSMKASDLIEMQTEVALAQSMAKSKTLTIMVAIAVLCIGTLSYFLFKSIGA
ncbi:hypothetical protein [Alteromonas sp. KUL49]|uniref:hypothetical protein n=1 Tax=Alteromonas sp. KUL49 TaxID=2480798 RepID=UPI0010FFC496|nr:hypothetical protein [Alteromonas sp. KUL49]GEA12498.1 hypothetical protein KUL49_28730 [Alteromonas sp. KUL49]